MRSCPLHFDSIFILLPFLIANFHEFFLVISTLHLVENELFCWKVNRASPRWLSSLSFLLPTKLFLFISFIFQVLFSNLRGKKWSTCAPSEWRPAVPAQPEVSRAPLFLLLLSHRYSVLTRSAFQHVKSCLFLVGHFNLLGKKQSFAPSPFPPPIIFVVYVLYKLINILAEFGGKGIRNKNVSLSFETKTAMFRKKPIVGA